MVALNVQKENGNPEEKVLNVETGEIFDSAGDAGKSITQYLQRSANVAVELVQHQRIHWEYIE